ncbi:3D domain-containing protein [Bdellovibrio reynosensis]|uniref:3D domain-containing protein n=1 Tax=Bdellovibrio reynosensis TaxID=2835041 RepID=A0ABY4C4K4_9BACT|nr:3D domain-containing protein [Bdellovibrio reynosensis]UOE99871.1 3D domain-containing protein [Bdellovibrio reynosensis]
MNFYKLLLATVLVCVLPSCAAKHSDGKEMVPTIYYKPTINQKSSQCTADDLRDLLSPEGESLVTLCQKDFDLCLLQGSCFVDNGKEVISYNYHSIKDSVPRFIPVDLKVCPFGYGVRSSCLDPYFSVAADLKYYKPGDVIFIPRLEGAVLPNREVHDGFMIVRDSGGGVLGQHRFDFFTGFFDHRSRQNTLARLGFGDPKNRFEYRMATEAESQAVRTKRNYPGLKASALEEGYLTRPHR